MAGHRYLVFADRFSGWTEVASVQKSSNSTTIINILRRYFATFGVPEQLSSDGGPPFESSDFKTFLASWNITHRLSSAYFAQSNGRAESAVKTMKRILTSNITQSGSLDTRSVTKALFLHRNTPAPDMGVSPAELLFGRNIPDHLPHPIQFRREWSELADAREKTHRRRYYHATKHEKRRNLSELQIGDIVAVQNKTGKNPTRWDKTGHIVEILPHRQYKIRIDGSRRVTLRNRAFIKKIVESTRNHIDDDHPDPTSMKNLHTADIVDDTGENHAGNYVREEQVAVGERQSMEPLHERLPHQRTNTTQPTTATSHTTLNTYKTPSRKTERLFVILG